jgi:uncharacterized protein YbjT (DUF2867 family)
MSILVLGASGQVGQEVANNLKALGAGFKAAYRKPDDAAKAQANGVATVFADYADPSGLDTALGGIDKVFFVTNAPGHVAELEANVVAAAIKAKVGLIVKLSAIGVDGEGFSLGKPHRRTEELIEASGLPYVFIRPNGFFQNTTTQAGLIKAQGLLVAPGADAAVSEIDVRDIGRSIAAVLTTAGHENTAYTLTGPKAITGAEKAEILSSVLGKPVHFVTPPDDEWKRSAMGIGIPEILADGIIDLQHFYIRGEASVVTDAVKTLTGREPTSFQNWALDSAALFA